MKQKEFKEQNSSNNIKKEGEMGLLGNGQGILGIPRRRNWIFVVTSVIGIIGMLYFYNQKNYLLLAGVLAIVLIILSSLGRR